MPSFQIFVLFILCALANHRGNSMHFKPLCSEVLFFSCCFSTMFNLILSFDWFLLQRVVAHSFRYMNSSTYETFCESMPFFMKNVYVSSNFSIKENCCKLKQPGYLYSKCVLFQGYLSNRGEEESRRKEDGEHFVLMDNSVEAFNSICLVCCSDKCYWYFRIVCLS